MQLPRFDPAPHIRLIACDMDGTLLDAEHAIHDEFWPLLDQLKARDILFCPASGRQYFNLLECFGPRSEELAFIAENGCLVMQGGRELSADCIAPGELAGLNAQARALQAAGVELGAVLCGKRSAYIEARDAQFASIVARFYQRLEIVESLGDVQDEVLKFALHHAISSEAALQPHFARFRPALQVVVSGQNWLDIMPPAANKGRGLRNLQQALGIARSQTMVFGDFLNDLEMMDEADYAFAMANAHPQLKARARYHAPANTENGVVRCIRAVLGLS
ncbi:Cof-type HAD-IIB family hydrolase [Uliginosibacterium sediminicola]|uniref:Cof-type HAD-IIB family hydrolase n=1 Tax=Uliginosibacterium sediminicola TaxID=2024550 RepID=A0ABU9Z1A6_9RHOO